MQCTTAGFSNCVVFCVAIVLGLLPRPLDPAFLFHADEGGIKRALIQRERMVRYLLEARCNVIRMQGAHRLESSQDDQVQCPLEKFNALASSSRHSRQLCSDFTRLSSTDVLSAMNNTGSTRIDDVVATALRTLPGVWRT